MVGCRVSSSAIQEHNIIQREDSGHCNAMGVLVEDLEWSVDCQAARRAPISLEGAEWPGGAESRGKRRAAIRMSISGGRRGVIGTPTSQEGTEKRKAPSHHHAVLDNP